MKKMIPATVLLAAVLLFACRKDKVGPGNLGQMQDTTATISTTNGYSSLNDFFEKSVDAKQTYQLDAAMGGTFVSPQGTTLSIPANAFYASGKIRIEFKDLYRKSDMIFSKVCTNLLDGSPLVSAGEFCFSATDKDNRTTYVAPNKRVDVILPYKNPADKAMTPYVAVSDTASKTVGWMSLTTTSLTLAPTGYVYSLFNHNSGYSWHNCDHPIPNIIPTKLSVQVGQTDPIPNIYLILKNKNSVVPVYKSFNNANFIYNYAPLGEEGTLVCIVVKDGKIYSCFKTLTISANQTITVEMSETTDQNFKTALKALD